MVINSSRQTRTTTTYVSDIYVQIPYENVCVYDTCVRTSVHVRLYVLVCLCVWVNV